MRPSFTESAAATAVPCQPFGKSGFHRRARSLVDNSDNRSHAFFRFKVDILLICPGTFSTFDYTSGDTHISW